MHNYIAPFETQHAPFKTGWDLIFYLSSFLKIYLFQTALAVFCMGKCAGENNGSTIYYIVLAKVARGRSSGETARNAD